MVSKDSDRFPHLDVGLLLLSACLQAGAPACAQVLEALWARFESQWYHDWLGLQAEKGAGTNLSKRCAELSQMLRAGATVRNCQFNTYSFSLEAVRCNGDPLWSASPSQSHAVTALRSSPTHVSNLALV